MGCGLHRRERGVERVQVAHVPVMAGPRQHLGDVVRRLEPGLDRLEAQPEPLVVMHVFQTIDPQAAFIARLQECQASPAPVLARIETRAGHGAGKPTAKVIEEVADEFAFLVKNLDMAAARP